MLGVWAIGELRCACKMNTAVRGTRLSASLILACLAEGMSVEEIEETYRVFPHEALPEIMEAAWASPQREPPNCLAW